MSIFEWADKKIKAQTMCEVGALKFFCMIVGMILGAYISAWVIHNVWWLVGIAAILFLFLLIKWFKN